MTETGWCVYCKQDTEWSVHSDEDNRFRFTCTRCNKIERVVALSDPGGQ